MDSSHKFGVAEECNSSESGWTMYIGSPINGGDDDDDDDDDGGGGGGGDDHESNSSDDGGDEHCVKAEDESDDSMASDASSGPSHRGRPSWEKENKVDKNGGKNCSQKKAKNINPGAKSGCGRKIEEKKKEGSAFNSKEGDKVRKNSSWLGKRK